MRVTRPALLIDGAARGDIGVVRSLGAAGVPVILLSAHRRSVTATSRYVTRTYPFPATDAPAAERVARLREVAAGLPERPVLFASGDRSLRFLSEHRDALDDVLDHDLAPRDTVGACFEKDRFADFARTHGLPVPGTWVVRTGADLEAALPALDFPVFVKPATHDAWGTVPRSVVPHVKGGIVRDDAALRRLFAGLADAGAGPTLVQEFVAGDDDLHYDVHAYADASGRVVRAFSGRKLRIHPPHAGLGAFVVSDHQPELIALAAAALHAIPFRGIANMNFKRDGRTGAFKLLEINCRYSTWTELPFRAGCNMPAAGYAALTGQPVPEVRQRDGVAWMDLRRDRSALRTYRAEGGWPLRAYLASLARVRCFAFFAPDDPRPFAHQLLYRNAN